jgi:hypothetical protein
MTNQHTPGPEDLIDMDRFVSALPSQRNRMLREARSTYEAMLNPQPDGGYPGCDFCTCPAGYCHQNAAIAKVTGVPNE